MRLTKDKVDIGYSAGSRQDHMKEVLPTVTHWLGIVMLLMKAESAKGNIAVYFVDPPEFILWFTSFVLFTSLQFNMNKIYYWYQHNMSGKCIRFYPLSLPTVRAE